MARIETDPNYTGPTFSRATAATDLFKKEDVQNLAAAMSTHDHTSGKGLVLGAGAIPSGLITSAMIANSTIVSADLADNAVTTTKLNAQAVTQVLHAEGTTSGPTTTSASFVDMPEMAITGTYFGGEILCWFWATVGNATANAIVQMGIQLDGGADTLMGLHTSAVASALGVSAMFAYMGQQSGSHTLKIRWATFGGGTASCNGILRRMLVLEVKR